MAEHRLPVDDVQEGERVTIQLEGREISIFNIDGEFYAHLNWCAHQGGPACEGTITGTVEASFDRDALENEFNWCREGEVLNCPWHGWEYDITTGECLSQNDVELPSYPIRVDDGEIIISL